MNVVHAGDGSSKFYCTLTVGDDYHEATEPVSGPEPSWDHETFDIPVDPNRKFFIELVSW